MVKKMVTLWVLCCFLFVGCGDEKEITLNLSYGERTGTYSGELVDGVPNGEGTFTSENEEGEEWTYEGEFKNGHFEGKGKVTWENGHIEEGTFKDDVIVPIKGKELKTLFTTPENFKNNCIEVIGKVFAEPEYDEDGVGIQIFADYKNHENGLLVIIPDKDFEVENGDYVKIVGIVGDVYEGQNIFGNTLSFPTVVAKEYSVLSYKDATAPTKKTIDVNETQTQLGYSITVQKVELAETETRVYLKVDNQGKAVFHVYGFNAQIVQNGKQYSEQSNWEADYPEVQSELLAGAYTEGVITFPPLKEDKFSLHLQASSGDWNEDIETYIFNIK